MEPADPVQPTTAPSTDPATPNPTNPANSGSPGAPVSVDNSNDPGYFTMGMNFTGHDASGLPTRRAVDGFLRVGPVSGSFGDACQLVSQSLGDGCRLVSQSLGECYRGLTSTASFYFLVIVAAVVLLVYKWMNRQSPLGQDGNTPNNGTQ